MDRPVTRRSFLLAGAGLAAGIVGACSKGSKNVIKVDDPTSQPGPNDISLVVASYIHVAGINQRVTLALIQANGPFKGTGPVAITIDDQPVPYTLHTQGISLPYYLVRHTFPKAGIYTVKATVAGKTLSAPLQVVDPSAATVPIPGSPLIRVATPTVAAAMGVNPICTRQPACPLHDVSLDAAMDAKTPIALLFATPALCQSRLCGPVLDSLLAQKDAFAGKIRFLHSEIYTDLTGKTLTQPVQAYHLESEPFLFLAGADGIVRERLDNAYDQVELADALHKLVAA
ncbi:MAG TPA: hypothetical protein VFA94_01765 [Acidimicrobiales bacterium]|nr:hypothetical protein [Acidimicrobiales bacterium]